jgi:hypothetical protein
LKQSTFAFLALIVVAIISSKSFSQTQVLVGESVNKLSAAAKRDIEISNEAAAMLIKENVRPEDYMKLLDKAVWGVNEQITFREYYLDGACGDFDGKEAEYVTGSLHVSKKAESLNKPFRFELMFPFDVVRDNGAYVSFCNQSIEKGNIVQHCEGAATFVLSYSSCNEAKQVCIVGLDNFYISKSGVKLNLYSYIKSNNYIELAYYGAHGFRRCAIPYTNIKKILN